MPGSSAFQRLDSSVEIKSSAHRAYELWSDCENFPKFLLGVQEVQRVTPQRLRWRTKLWGEQAEWDAEILEDIPDT
jgi:uncharacterized membrane protein